MGAHFLDGRLAGIHRFSGPLHWVTLGGVAHVRVDVFTALATIVRTLLMVPVRLGCELEGRARTRRRDGRWRRSPGVSNRNTTSI
jgi:hypothetical protein